LTNIVDNTLNVLLKEELIELPPIVEPKFSNGVAKLFLYEEFYNYHSVPRHLTRNYRTLRHLIQYFIDKKAIRMDDNTTTDDGPVHPDNRQLGVFTNPLPPSQPRGYIGMVSTSYDLNYTHKHKCRNENSNNGG